MSDRSGSAAPGNMAQDTATRGASAGETATPDVEAGGGRTGGRMATAIREHSEREGCGCLDCLGVETATLRRSFPDTLGWAARLCRAYPSIPALALAFVLAGRFLERASLPEPVAAGLGPLVAFGLWFGLRAYVASVAAEELAGGRPTPLARLRASLGRVALLGGVVWALVFGSFVLSTAVMTVASVVFVVAGVNPMAPFGVLPVFLATVALLVAPLLVLVFKLWLALEACVVGGYGPLGALRASWRLSTNHRGKLLGLLAGNLGVALVGPVIGAGGLVGPAGPLLTAVGTSAGELLSVVWYGAYAHLYVQSVLDA